MFMDLRFADTPEVAAARLACHHGRLVSSSAAPSPSLADTAACGRATVDGQEQDSAAACSVRAADRCPVPGASLGDLDEHALESLVRAEQERRSGSSACMPNRHSILTQLNVTDVNGSVRMAGLLCFGLYPQQFFPQLAVDVRAYACASTVAAGRAELVERCVCTGPIAGMVEEAVASMLRNLRRRTVVRPGRLRDMPEFPAEALRELIANAVLHREYSQPWTGRAVTVDIFTDRIEITNPGGLWGLRTIGSLAEGVSLCRNTALMALASRTFSPAPGAPVALGAGSGIRCAVRALAEAGLPEPIVSATQDSFTVTLPRPDTGDQEPHAGEAGARRARDAYAGTAYESGFRSWRAGPSAAEDSPGLLASAYGQTDAAESAPGRRVPRAVRTARLLEQLSAHTPKTVHELAQAIDATEATVRRLLAPLVADGSVIATAPATSRNRAYLKGPGI